MDELAVFWLMRHYGLLHKISNYLKQNERYKPTRGRKKELKCYTIWQMTAILHWNEQQRTEYCRPIPISRRLSRPAVIYSMPTVDRENCGLVAQKFSAMPRKILLYNYSIIMVFIIIATAFPAIWMLIRR